MNNKILIIGSGGREHAIGWKFAEDFKKRGELYELFFAPGNAGTSQLGTNISLKTIEDLKNFAIEQKIDLTFVGPEAELADGIVDVFHKENLQIFGPHKAAAQLEASKAFAKDFMAKYNIKTAKYKNFKGPMLAIEYVEEQNEFPIVVKASGLAAGKGVIICNDLDEAKKAILEIMEDKTFGDAGNEIVIEEYLNGFEASILSFFNGKKIVPFVAAKDHKKIGEGETGLNTGGMGVIAPNPLFTQEHYRLFEEDIMEPTKCGLIKEGLEFAGVIFFGLMITTKGVYLLEYNLRMGDPETQTTLPLLNSNLYDTVLKTINQEDFDLVFENKHACCVVMVSGGYPGNYEKGYEIRGLDKITCPNFIAGAINAEDSVITSGGRVLNIVGVGETADLAREIAYENVKKVHFDYEYYRTDIGLIN